ncbi:hypothetical protein [Streptomyces sp. NPDC048172]|uniref:hypothetical protein n=1 Tax=Streptomyces sp. NPDC048172 TaxID=3365505 RepID=UPI0037198BAD
MSDGDGASGSGGGGARGRHIVVPGPEAGWWQASSYQGNPNPALQSGLWQHASDGLRLVAGLRPPLQVLAARLLLRVEQSWEELSEVEVAMFRIRGTQFALCDMKHGRAEVQVWIGRDADMDPALTLLLDTLGIGDEALSFRWDGDTQTYVDLP